MLTDGFTLAGRELQYRQLTDALAQTLAGQPQLRLVAGRVGMGKTSLIQYFATGAQEQNPQLAVASAECSYGDAYLPFKSILALLAGSTETASPAQSFGQRNLQRLRALSGTLFESILELGPSAVSILDPFTGILLQSGSFAIRKTGVVEWIRAEKQKPPPPEPPKVEQIFELYGRILLRLAETTPLVVVLEDLHRADNGTLELFFHLAIQLKRAKQAQLLLVGSYCPEDLEEARAEQRHPLAKIVNEIDRFWPDVTVEMEPTVGGDAGRAFVNSLLDRHPNRFDKEFRHDLFRHTSGYAQFTVDMVKYLEERGLLVMDADGVWRSMKQINFSDLPRTLEALIRERIARLQKELRDLLVCGSVEGELFTAEVLARVQQIEELQLAQKLDEELDKHHRLIHSAGNVRLRSGSLHQYRFVVNLYREHLYDSLGGLHREKLHGAIGGVLEQLYGDEVARVAAQLAQHFLLAGVEEKAVKYFVLAGDRAFSLYSHKDALRQYEKARAVIAGSESDYSAENYRLTRALAQIYSLQGKNDGTNVELAKLEALIARLPAADQPAKLFDLYVLQARAAIQVSDFQRARQVGRKALRLARTNGGAGTLGAAALVLGEAHTFLTEAHGTALRYLNAALGYYQAENDTQHQAKTKQLLALFYLKHSDYEMATRYAEEALALFGATGDRVGENETLRYLGDINCAQGDYVAGLKKYQQVLRIRRQIGQRSREGGALGDRGDVYLALGYYERSLRLHQQSLAINEEVGYKYGQVWCHHDIGLIYHNLGVLAPTHTQRLKYLTSARVEIETAAHLAVEIKERDMLALCHNSLARACCELATETDDKAYLTLALNLAREAVKIGQRAALVSRQIVGEAYQALAHLELNDEAAALTRSNAALALLENHSGAAEVLVEEILFIHAGVVRESAGAAVAAGFLDKAYAEVMRKANRIKYGRLRQSFMERVPLNRQIIAQWEAQRKSG